MKFAYKNFISSVLGTAAKIASQNFGLVTSSVKAADSNQVLTKTDIEIGQLIVTSIQQQFPMHNIIDEEAGVINKNSDYTWVVDPIDGTSNFAAAIATYGILLGLLREGLPLAGGVVLPASKELYYAEKGSGAYCNGAPIFVSKEQKLINVLVAYGIDGHQENPEFTQKECEILAEIVLNIRNLRSSNSCFDFMQVAKGKYGAYLNQTSKIWDNVAPQIIIEEAGGVYTDFFGNPPDYSSPLEKTETNFTFCTGAPQLHQALQKIIKHKHK